MMIHHGLTFVPFTQDCAVRPRRLDATGIGDVASLDGVHAQAAVEVERWPELSLIADDVPGRFVMADNPHAFAARISGNAREVEIRIGLGETEIVAPAEPIAVPADIPAFDQYALEAVTCRKVDHAPGIGSRCTVLRP